MEVALSKRVVGYLKPLIDVGMSTMIAVIVTTLAGIVLLRYILEIVRSLMVTALLILAIVALLIEARLKMPTILRLMMGAG